MLIGLLELSESERGVLLAAGLGAGIAAIFKAPMAGAIFAISRALTRIAPLPLDLIRWLHDEGVCDAPPARGERSLSWHGREPAG
jgi:hypothetical protein